MIYAESESSAGCVEQEHEVNPREVTGIPAKGFKKSPKNM